MRKRPVVLIVVGLALAGSPGAALEKTAVPATEIERAEWDAFGTCTVSYYNFCTGWIWAWEGWGPQDVVGVYCDRCCQSTGVFGGANLVRSWVRVYTGAPVGYGFTGSIDVWIADANRCPATHLVGHPFYFANGWNAHSWCVWIITPFVVTVTCGPAPGLDSRLASDHPARGPTGPQACGLCYPERVCRSYYYGTSMSPLCPGSSLSDGVCCVEWVWDVEMDCYSSVELLSWGNVKALYR